MKPPTPPTSGPSTAALVAVLRYLLQTRAEKRKAAEQQSSPASKSGQ
jgi:hypothetical protein